MSPFFLTGEEGSGCEFVEQTGSGEEEEEPCDELSATSDGDCDDDDL